MKAFILLALFLLLVHTLHGVQFPINEPQGDDSGGKKNTEMAFEEDYPADDHGGAQIAFSQLVSDDSAINSKLSSPISSRSSAIPHGLNPRAGKKDVKIYKADIDSEYYIPLKSGPKDDDDEDKPDKDEEKGSISSDEDDYETKLDIDKEYVLDDIYAYTYDEAVGMSDE